MALPFLGLFVVVMLNVSSFAYGCGSFTNIFDDFSDESNNVQVEEPVVQQEEDKEYTDQQILTLFARRYLTILEESSAVSIQSFVDYQRMSLSFAKESDVYFLALKNGMRHLLEQIESDKELKSFLKIMDKHALKHEGMATFLGGLRIFFDKVKIFVSTEIFDLEYTKLLHNYLKWAPSKDELFKVFFCFFYVSSGIGNVLDDCWITDYVSPDKIARVVTTWFALVNTGESIARIREKNDIDVIRKIFKLLGECIDESAEELFPLFANTFYENWSEDDQLNFTDKALILLQHN